MLILLSKGLKRLVENNGKVRIITSPNLTQEDITAIKDGYDRRKTKEIVERTIIRDFREPKNEEERWYLGFLSWLIENSYMDIKIAFMKGNNGYLYHEKIGIFTDGDGKKIAFSGSSNETLSGVLNNYERIDVYPYWNYATKIKEMEEHFDEIWQDEENSLEIIEFPKVAIEKLHTYQPDYINNKEKYALGATCRITPEAGAEQLHPIKEKNVPTMPEMDLRDYQKEAIKAWEDQSFKGIFDMATGTGKTYTALGALVRLYSHCGKNLAVIICCPFRHLVEQWVEDLRLFNIDPIIGYSDSSDRKWKTRLAYAVDLHNHSGSFFCFITTNSTFKSEFVQQKIAKLNHQSLLIADEAHYMGSPKLAMHLPERFGYRLALSATIERFNDVDGTKAIFGYFGKKCIEYTLEMAIKSGKLTKYNYYPVIVYLNDEELSEYKNLTRKYASIAESHKDGTIPDNAKHFLIERSRIIAGAQEKVPQLIEIMTKKGYNKKDHILVYCGSASADEIDEANSDSPDNVKTQIDKVCYKLGNDLDMKVSRFTARENMKERMDIRKDFSCSDTQALVAIKCLDEGFNMPEIRTAFILASTTNPKEYIQRLGRGLRTAQGKDIAEIYDFITLPRPMEQAITLSDEEQKYEKGLVKKEFIRMIYYNNQANNHIENEGSIIMKLQKIYNLYHLHDINDIDNWNKLDSV